MRKYRKKPVVIEAIQFTEETKEKVFNWIDCSCYSSYDEKGNPIIVIQTLEGNMTVKPGDWVIKGINGEFYPCKPDIFEKTYEQVESENK